MPTRRRAVTTAALLTPLLAATLAGPAATAGAASAGGPLASSIAVDWQRTAARTIYVERGSAPAPRRALPGLHLARGPRRGTRGAAARHPRRRRGGGPGRPRRAPRVLPAVRRGARRRPGRQPRAGAGRRKEDAGVAIGAAAADAMIASRVDDGRNDPSIVYTKTAALGIWQAAAGRRDGAALARLRRPGRRRRARRPRRPRPAHQRRRTPRTTRRSGRSGRSRLDDAHPAEQTAIAEFFAANPIAHVPQRPVRPLDAEPMGLLPTTRLFARIDAAVATAFIQTWRLKYEVGFWRPFQAIAARRHRRQRRHQRPHPGPGHRWSPTRPTPTTRAATRRRPRRSPRCCAATFGDDTPLVLKAGGVQRSYATLSALEHDALNARIWGGLHFRDAMDDGYHLGHTTAAPDAPSRARSPRRRAGTAPGSPAPARAPPPRAPGRAPAAARWRC